MGHRGRHLPARRAQRRRPLTLLDSEFIDDDTLARVSGRRIIGYHERVHARLPSDGERATLQVEPANAVLTLTRITRTTTTPLAILSLAARIDRFEVDYLIDA